jgi:hypothetical protein
LSTFKAIGGEKETEGYMLEPSGPSTTTPNQDKRIPEGVYNIDKYSSSRHPNCFLLYNEDVPKSRKILYHAGNSGCDTSGCNLPGSRSKHTPKGYVSNSKQEMKQLRQFIYSKGVSNVKTIIINNIP